jgi:hypothetical protein
MSNDREMLSAMKHMASAMLKFASPDIETKADEKVDINYYPIPKEQQAAYGADKTAGGDELKGYANDALPKLNDLIAKEGATKHVAACTADVASRIPPNTEAYKQFVGKACADYKDDTADNLLAAIKANVAQLNDIFTKNPDMYKDGKDHSDVFAVAADTVVKARGLYAKATN